MSTTLSTTNQGNVYYKHSGAIGWTGPIYMVIFGTVVTLVLSIIYGYAIYNIPFIYLNFFITLFYGAIVGYTISFAGELGKVRNMGILVLFGFVFGLLAEYAGWVSWISAAIGEFAILTIFFSPGVILYIIQVGAEEGIWSIFGWTPTGLALYIIWGIEAIMVVGAVVLTAIGSLIFTPFCERCNRRVEQKETISLLEPITNPNELKAQLEQGNYTSLNVLKRVEAGSKLNTELELSQCPTCQQFHLLTVKSVTIKVDSKGEGETERNNIVKNLLLDTNTYEIIRTCEHS